MDNLSMGPLHPMADMICWLVLAGIGIWLLTRVDEEARDAVERRRAWGYPIDDYPREFEKWKVWIRWTAILVTAVSLSGVLYNASWI